MLNAKHIFVSYQSQLNLSFYSELGMHLTALLNWELKEDDTFPSKTTGWIMFFRAIHEAKHITASQSTTNITVRLNSISIHLRLS